MSVRAAERARAEAIGRLRDIEEEFFFVDDETREALTQEAALLRELIDDADAHIDEEWDRQCKGEQ
jgi:hypothetical protein